MCLKSLIKNISGKVYGKIFVFLASLEEETKKQAVSELSRIPSELETAAPASPSAINENAQANGIPDDRQSVSSTDNLVGFISVQWI